MVSWAGVLKKDIPIVILAGLVFLQLGVFLLMPDKYELKSLRDSFVAVMSDGFRSYRLGRVVDSGNEYQVSKMIDAKIPAGGKTLFINAYQSDTGMMMYYRVAFLSNKLHGFYFDRTNRPTANKISELNKKYGAKYIVIYDPEGGYAPFGATHLGSIYKIENQRAELIDAFH